MKVRNIVLSLFLLTLIVSCSTVEKLHKKPIGLINSVTYLDSSFNNPNAANGFLVNYENQTYGITAKHVLVVAKTEEMEFIDFEGGLKEWKMHPKNDTTKYIVMDKLLNSNRKDSLTWSYISNNRDSYEDWLIFSVKENKSKYKPLKFRNKQLMKGENLYVIGWSYSDTIGPQRVYEYIYDKTEKNYHHLIQKNGPTSLAGLSGAPIVDEKGKLVGLVSSGGKNVKTKEVILLATPVKNMLEFIKEVNRS
ncbi:trypsin-like peptidase domain-containing protein [Gaetbulibacter saemankumensis]|uniref:trypsin-like peptidase domain-containing protein n=1 Tax=Gaetbulibacter saemankumensis TaxID=311208 RepID=UPI0003F64753|nr:trypsin-like peptidase domain-containing protein [Gaetbulibacter saemankumensis]